MHALVQSSIVATLLLLFPLPTFGADEVVRFPRYPAVSPDGQTVVFTYEGDLWRVGIEGGRATRLTVHPAYDRRGVFSPDGGTIAFSSNRTGGEDIYLMPVDGGRPRRATHCSAFDVVADWFPNGDLLFVSARDAGWTRTTRHYRLALSTVKPDAPIAIEPERVIHARGSGGTLSPDGSSILFVREGTVWSRKRYRGAQAEQVWHYDMASDRYRPLARGEGRHSWPLPHSDGVTYFFVKNDGRTDQLYRGRLDSNEFQRVTDFDDDGVRFPFISRDGSTIVFEQGFDLWSFDVATGESRRVPITIRDDFAADALTHLNLTSASEVAPSPDGKQIAFVCRGEVWVRRAEDGLPANRITRSAARERGVRWHPDGDRLLFVSDRDGRDDLFLAASSDPDEPRLDRCLSVAVQRLPGAPAPRRGAAYSPDGKSLAYISGPGNLSVCDAAGGEGRVVVESWNAPQYQWSPDSRWLAYAKLDNDYNNDIWIVPLDGHRPATNITVHPGDDSSPVWSPDGKKLAFVSDRRGDSSELWWVWLEKKYDQETAEDRELAADPPPVSASSDSAEKEEKPSGGRSKAKKVASDPECRIDFDKMHRRFRRAFSSIGDEYAPIWSPDSKEVAFLSRSDGGMELKRIALPGGRSPKTISRGGGRPVAWLAKTKKIYRLSSGTPQAVTSSGKATSFSFRARYAVDRVADRGQVFREAWRVLDERYYDPEHGGADWDAMAEKYGPISERRRSKEEFGALFSMMLGELNGSHLSFSASGRYSTETPQTGVLGVEFGPDDGQAGRVIVDVTPGGPADFDTTHLEPGDRVLAIGGEPVDARTNLSARLAGEIGRRVPVRIRRADGREEQVIVRPISMRALRNLEYEAWVASNREVVDARSDGRLGYLHIRSMDTNSLERFEAELFSVGHGREALLIDVRDNGGGWTTDYLLAMLSRTPHTITVPRDGGPGYPVTRLVRPSWTRPIAVICNQNSFSNAEIFTHSIRSLGRGKVIGVSTAGGVISTGRATLLDGSSVRVPGRGWYVAGTGQNMELNGAQPDFEVWMTPEAEVRGNDPQLDRAIEVLLEDLPTAERRAL